jgi:hypothetical protein
MLSGKRSREAAHIGGSFVRQASTTGQLQSHLTDLRTKLKMEWGRLSLVCYACFVLECVHKQCIFDSVPTLGDDRQHLFAASDVQSQEQETSQDINPTLWL